jgi:TRAP transporter 4TM/12TM fusion protein
MSDETMSTFRQLKGADRMAADLALGAITVFGVLWVAGVHQRLGLMMLKEQFLGVILGLGLCGTFLLVRRSRRETGPNMVDRACALAGLLCGGYIAVNYDTLVLDLSRITPERLVIGAVTLLLVCEASRRLIGWSLIALAAIFIGYALFADRFPGVLNAPSSSPERILVYLFLDNGGLYGAPLDVAASVIIPFILFGVLLTAVGADRFITDLALAAFGRYRGGPAKVSIFASMLFGTVSGSAVSNVAMVGPISIPMMKRAGYPPYSAAAIEAVASTGGQIMPPVMGITAFLIADYLSVPYLTVVTAALLPALLYYVALFMQADLEAARRGLAGLDPAQIPRASVTLRAGWPYLIPLVVLVHAMVFASWDPGPAGLLASACTIFAAFLSPHTRPKLGQLARAVIACGRTMLDLIVLCGMAGLIIGTLQISGLSFNFSNTLLAFSAGNLMVLLVMTGFVCIVLGMALPTAVIYTMMAVLVAPALTEFGMLPIAAHLFILYMGMLSMITPPVGLATFTATAIAGSNFWRTSLAAMQFGIVAIALPFAFPFSPGLLMQGGVVEIVSALVSALLGIASLSAGLTGQAWRPLSWPLRVMLVLAGLMLLPSPGHSQTLLLVNIVGFGLAAAALVLSVRQGPAASPDRSR